MERARYLPRLSDVRGKRFNVGSHRSFSIPSHYSRDNIRMAFDVTRHLRSNWYTINLSYSPLKCSDTLSCPVQSSMLKVVTINRCSRIATLQCAEHGPTHIVHPIQYGSTLQAAHKASPALIAIVPTNPIGRPLPIYPLPIRPASTWSTLSPQRMLSTTVNVFLMPLPPFCSTSPARMRARGTFSMKFVWARTAARRGSVWGRPSLTGGADSWPMGVCERKRWKTTRLWRKM